MVISVLTIIIAFVYIVGPAVFFIIGLFITRIAEAWAKILDKDTDDVGGYVLLTLVAIILIIAVVNFIMYKANGV